MHSHDAQAKVLGIYNKKQANLLEYYAECWSTAGLQTLTLYGLLKEYNCSDLQLQG